jgi:hypothetical protein
MLAIGDAVARAQRHDEGSGALRSRIRMAGPTMALNLRENRLAIEGEGTLLIEDYRLPKSAASAENADATRNPFGRRIGGEPSQTFIAWRDGMTYRYEKQEADFSREVRLVHRTGTKMKAAERLLGKDAVAAFDGKGREAQLSCDDMSVQFLREKQKTVRRGTRQMSGLNVESFDARGSVHFSDGPVSAIARQIQFAREDNTLRILGSDQVPAELYIERGGTRTIRGPRFEWNRTTNRVLAPRSRGSMQ